MWFSGSGVHSDPDGLYNFDFPCFRWGVTFDIIETHILYLLYVSSCLFTSYVIKSMCCVMFAFIFG